MNGMPRSGKKKWTRILVYGSRRVSFRFHFFLRVFASESIDHSLSPKLPHPSIFSDSLTQKMSEWQPGGERGEKSEAERFSSAGSIVSQIHEKS